MTNKHDKIFRTILDKKEEAMALINQAIKTKLKAEEIEKYTSSFVNKIFENREADIVYKYKNKNIFFLIEHQTKIDYSMPYRILEYEIEIMKSAIDIKKVKNKEYKLPLVIPIVLYTGKKRWDAKRYLEESQETLDGVEIKAGNYNLVDINDFTKEELLQEKTLISKMMLLEKSESTEESIEMLEKIISNTNKEEKELLKRVISILFGEKIGEEKTKELIEKIDGGEEKMLALVDMIRNENQMYINIGKKEGRKEGKKEKCLEIAKNLLKINMPISQISEVTKMSKEEIAKIK
ncbi:MAG: Rpn family recombination-promoting nuclease/putative transposase [Clostridia bacterium]